MIEIFKNGDFYFVRFIGVEDWKNGNNASLVWLVQTWEENYDKITEEYRREIFKIDKYIYEHPEEFKEIFNKVKVKNLL